VSKKAKLKLVFCLVFFIQGCIPLAYTFKEAIPSKIRAQGEAQPLLEIDDPQQVRRFAEKEAHNAAIYNLLQKVEKMYVTPWRRVGNLMMRYPQVKLEVLNLVQQARIRRTRFLGKNKIMVEVELDGEKLKEVLTPYR